MAELSQQELRDSRCRIRRAYLLPIFFSNADPESGIGLCCFLQSLEMFRAALAQRMKRMVASVNQNVLYCEAFGIEDGNEKHGVRGDLCEPCYFLFALLQRFVAIL